MNITNLNQQLQYLLDNFNLDQGQGGGSLCIFYQGELVTALASGIARDDSLIQQNNATATDVSNAWSPTTLALNFSTGKGMLVTLIHCLVSQNLLAYDTPIADYWQDFGKNGKKNITLRQILSHEAGLFDITSVTENAKDMLDWQAMLAKVAAMPVSPQKLASVKSEEKFIAYSALVSGWILGGLVEKVTGLDLQTALDTYLAKPLGMVGQMYFGVPLEKISQVATPIREKSERNMPTLTEDSSKTLAFYQNLPMASKWETLINAENQSPNSSQSTPVTQAGKARLDTPAINGLYFDASKIDMADYKSALVPAGSRHFDYYHSSSLYAKIPAANGVASSLALASMYAMLANGGRISHKNQPEPTDTTLITPAVFDQLATLQNNVFDKIMPAAMQWRLGYHRVFSLNENSQQAFGHMGYNSSMAWCDPSRELAVAFVHNYDVTMLNDVRQFIINETILDFFKEC